jgi:hypothetical protein
MKFDELFEKIMKEEDNEYQKFFKKTLKDKFDANSPAELDDEKKKEFFAYIKKNWTKDED